MRTGERIKLTQKSVSFHVDNLWDRGVASYHLPLFGVTLDREYQPVVTKVTKKYIYQNTGCRYRLGFSLIGYVFEIWWHSHNPKQEKIAL